MKKLHKCFLVAALAAVLVCSNTVTALAADMAPRDYIFSMVLRSCGVVPYSEIGQWRAAYEGYLERTGNQALLNQVKGYDNLSWGATAQGIDTLYWSVRGWLSSGSISEKPDANGSYIYSMPSKPAPQFTVPSVVGEEYYILSAPFSDVNPLPSDKAGQYTYFFSYVYTAANNNRPIFGHSNAYVPNGVEVFGIANHFRGYSPYVTVSFYTRDSSSATGYSLFDVSRMATEYFMSDGSLICKYSGLYPLNRVLIDVRSAMNSPFKVFASASDAQAYCKTGVVNGTFSKDTMALWARGDSAGADFELRNQKVLSVGNSMKLPSDLSAANSKLSAIRTPLELDTLTSALKDGGMEIAYSGTYTVEHYKQDVSDLSAPVTWVKESEESFTGTVGQPARITPNTYPNYTYDSGLTEPQEAVILPDGRLVICLYYKADLATYTVEHYKQDVSTLTGPIVWVKESEESFTGAVGQPAQINPKTYPNYIYDSDLTEPQEAVILPDDGLAVRLYYKVDPSPSGLAVGSLTGMSGSIIKAALALLPRALLICCVLLVVWFLLRFFKRITSDA